MAETETVGLNLDGSFERQAEKDAQAAVKLEGALGKLAATEGKVKGGAVAGSSASGVKLPSRMSDALGGANLGELTQGASKLEQAAEKLGVAPEMLSKAGTMLSGAAGIAITAGKVIAEAAAALAAAAGVVIAAGLKLGIEESSKTDVQGAILDHITKGKGSAALNLATKLALDIGIDDDEAIPKVKKLLQAKFTQKEIEVNVKIAAAIDAVEGQGKGQEYLDKLAKMKLEPKVSAKDIKGLAELGLDTKEVYAELARKLGTDVATAEAKVKNGLVDTQTVIDAIEKTGNKTFGGLADKLANSVPALLARIKLSFKNLFGDMDLGPLKGFLKNVVDTLQGPAGKGLGKAITELGNTIIKTLFGPLDGGGGKDKLVKLANFITGVIKGITKGIETIKPYVAKAIDFFKDLFSPKQGSDGVGAKIREIGKVLGLLLTPAGAAIKIAYGVFQALWPIMKLPVGIALVILPPLFRALGAAFMFVFGPVFRLGKALTDFGGIASKTGKSAGGVGSAIVDGIIGGLKSGLGRLMAAAAGMASAALAKIKSILGVASPAKELVFVGKMMGAGMAQGNEQSTELVKRSAAKMAGAGAGAAAGAAGGAGARGGGAGGGAPVFNITINAAPGMTSAQAQQLGGAAVDGAYEAWKKNARRFSREQQEGRAA